MRTIGYVVVTYNQASGQPEVEGFDIYASAQQARRRRDDETANTRELGRRERRAVAELIEVD